MEEWGSPLAENFVKIINFFYPFPYPILLLDPKKYWVQIFGGLKKIVGQIKYLGQKNLMSKKM